jgi:hypothetical protein
MNKPTHIAYNELQTAYDFFNARLFQSELPFCLITLQRQARTYGYFSRERFANREGDKTDEIAMNPAHFSGRSIEETLSTLVHEMAHLWQSHFGKKMPTSPYHNKEWATKMESLGLIPTDTGQPGGKKTGFKMTHYIAADGPFATECAALITQKYTISWYDRFPEAERARLKGGGDDDDEEGSEDEGTEKASKVKIKYTHKCEDKRPANVWGKAGLNLLCGLCNEPFEPAS